MACSTDDELFTVVPSPTEIAVDPLDFLGAVHCSNNAGAMKSYVVTLTAYDDAADTTGFTLPSSQPTPCAYVTAFRDLVVVGKRYTAEVDGYEQQAGQLVPFGGSSGGSRQKLESTTKESLVPRWTTRCGQAAQSATLAVSSDTSYVTGCDPLDDATGSQSLLSVDPSSVLGSAPCEQASSFDIVDVAGTLPPLKQVPCGSLPIDLQVEPNERYELYATATNLDSDAVGTMCFAQSVAGETVTLSCNPISSVGAIRLDLSKPVDGQNAPICPAGAFFDVILNDEALNPVPLECDGWTHVGPIEPGVYLFDIPIYDAVGDPVGNGTTCTATALAGRTVDAICL